MGPLAAAARAARDSRGENWAVGGQYIVDVLNHLRHQAGAMTSALISRHDRDAAVMTLIATIDREANAVPCGSAARPVTPTNGVGSRGLLGSPVQFDKLASLGGSRVPFLTPRRGRRRSVDQLGMHSKSEFPEFALLAHLGLSLPMASSTRSPMPAAPPVITASFLASEIAGVGARVESLLAGTSDGLSKWEEARIEAAETERVLEEALWAGNQFRVVGAGEAAMGTLSENVRAGVKEVEEAAGELTKLLSRAMMHQDELKNNGGDLGGTGKKKGFVARWHR